MNIGCQKRLKIIEDAKAISQRQLEVLKDAPIVNGR
jgi:hypothetical protein